MIIFRKSGIFHDNEVNPEHEDYEIKQVESIIPYLNDVIEFDENITLRDFFALLEPDEQMIEKVFGSHLGHHPIRPYMEEALNDGVPDGRVEMDYIECCWVAEQFDYRVFYEKHKNDEKNENSFMSQLDMELHEPDEDDVNEVSLYVDVHGWGPYHPSEGEEENYEEGYTPPSKTSYAIEFTPLNRMSHLPLKINNYVEIRDKNELGDEEPLVEGNMYFSVFELVGAILSEISFCGLPDERNQRWQDIVDTVDEAKEKFGDEDDDEDDEDEYHKEYDGE